MDGKQDVCGRLCSSGEELKDKIALEVAQMSEERSAALYAYASHRPPLRFDKPLPLFRTLQKTDNMRFTAVLLLAGVASASLLTRDDVPRVFSFLSPFF